MGATAHLTCRHQGPQCNQDYPVCVRCYRSRRQGAFYRCDLCDALKPLSVIYVCETEEWDENGYACEPCASWFRLAYADGSVILKTPDVMF